MILFHGAANRKAVNVINRHIAHAAENLFIRQIRKRCSIGVEGAILIGCQRIKAVALPGVKSSAVELVRSRACDLINVRASIATILSGKRVGDDLKFLNRFGRKVLAWNRKRLIVVVRAVNRKIIRARAIAVNGKAGAGSPILIGQYTGIKQR